MFSVFPKIFILILILGNLFILSPFFLNPANLVLRNGDYSDYVWPNYFFIRSAILNYGQIPLWNPTQLSGIPEIANPGSALIYPLNAISLVFPLEFSIVVLILLHTFFAGIFLYLIGKEVFKWESLNSSVLALVFSLSPYLWSKFAIGHLSVGFALCLIAPIIYFSLKLIYQKNKKNILLLGLFLAFLYLNHPTIWVYTLIFGSFLILYLILIQKVFYKISYFFLAYLVTLILISPILFLHLQASSLISRSNLSLTETSLPIWSITRFVESTLIPSNLLKDIETETWLYPSLIVIILSIFGFTKLPTKFKIPFFIVISLTVLIALGNRTPVFLILREFLPGFSYLRISTRVWFVLIYSVTFLAAFGLTKTNPKFKYLLVIVMLLDLLIFSTIRVWFVPDVMKYKVNDDLIPLLIEDRDFRYYCTNRCLSQRETLPRSIRSADGYHLFLINHYNKAISDAGGFSQTAYTGNIPSYEVADAQPNAKDLGKFNVKYLISRQDITDENFKKIKSSGEYSLYLNELAKENYYFENEVKNSLRVIYESPNEIIFESNGEEDKLMIANTYYPGWNVYIDNKESAINTEEWAMSVLIPQGKHIIKLKFEPFKDFNIKDLLANRF